MALVKINPAEAKVRWDRQANRPTRIRLADRDLTVVNLAARRDELAAFPADRGPRVTYLVDTDDGQLERRTTTNRLDRDAVSEAYGRLVVRRGIYDHGPAEPIEKFVE